MPQNLPQQILQRIVRLSAYGICQGGVARMLGMSQECISKILQRNRETGRPPWRFDENLQDMRRLSIAPNGQNELLHLSSSSANADDPPIWEADVSSNHSETASGHRILVSASSQMSKAHFGAQATTPMSEGVGTRVSDLRQWRLCIFSDESRFPLYHSDGRVWVRRRQGERLIDACV